MKPFSLSVLLLLTALAAQADVVMVSGTVYDVGKGAYSGDANTVGGDSQMCWAATASNLLQHWQNEYLPASETAVPNGFATPTYTKPTGTRYLNIYNDFCNNFINFGGTLKNAMNWYTYGYGQNLKTSGTGKYLLNYGVQGKEYVWGNDGYSNEFNSMAQFKNILEAAFQYEGYGVFIGFNVSGYGNGHAVTCWGYETDASNQNVTALYIADSDDGQFGARRVDIRQNADGTISLSSDYGHYSDGLDYTLNQVSYLSSSVAKHAKSDNTTLPSDGVLTGAANISGQTVTSTDGISAEAGSILAAAGEDKTTLTLGPASGTANGTGLAGKVGSMLTLDNTDVSISHFSGNGLSAAAEARLNNGNVSIADNGGWGVSVQASATDTKTYLQMAGNTTVDIERNTAGGVYVEGFMRLNNNGTVTIADNQGKGLTSKGSVNVSGKEWTGQSWAELSGNGSVVISGNKAGGIYTTSGRSSSSLYEGTVVLDNNTSVLVSGNSGTLGGGAQSSGALIIKNNTAVTFDKNTASSGGGAIAVTVENGAAGEYQGNLTITGNDSIAFTDNTATGKGGAIYGAGPVSIKNNGTVSFSGNTSNSGGSTYATTAGGGGLAVVYQAHGNNTYSGTTEISGNKVVEFKDNVSQANGGAIYVNNNLSLVSNESVSITGNRAVNGAGIYVANEVDRPSTSTKLYVSSAHFDGNTKLDISNNTATGGDIVFGKTNTFTISNNGDVTFAGNNAGTGNVIHNGDSVLKYGTSTYTGQVSPVMEIAHNKSVTFAGNTAKYDIYNETTAYICADAGQTVTFQHGFKNAPASTAWPATAGGTTYLGKDSSNNVSEGGTYIFADNGHSVTLETTVATVKANGGMVYDGSTLEVTKTDFGGTNLKLVLDASSVKLTDVAFVDEAVINVDFGYYEAMNKLTMSNVTGDNVSLGLKLDLTQKAQGRSQAPLTMSDAELRLMGDLEDVTLITLSDYLDVAKDKFDLSLIVDGWQGEGSKLAIDASGYELSEVDVRAKAYEYDRTEGNILYYYGKAEALIPEPSTATLSLLALAGLAARRRRKA